jgi:hypothetical protein
MKVRGIFLSLLLILTGGLIFISGCQRYGDIAQSSSEKAITAYAINGVAGTINETGKTIAVTMPSLTNVSSLRATFTTTGASVKVGSTAQVSGATPNNFTSPITYTVTAEDGTTVTYTVTVTVNRAWYNPAGITDNISPDGRRAELPQVAMDNNGNAIIVWQQYNGANYQIFKSVYKNGVWIHPSNLTDHISSDAYDAHNPQVAMDNNGNAIIVWEQNNGIDSQIFKSEYRGGIWANPVKLADITSPFLSGWDLLPHVAMDNNGNAIIVWQQDDGAGWQVFKSEYGNGVWTNPLSLTDHISLDGYSAGSSQVAMDNNGNAIIVWGQSDGTNSQIFKSECRGGIWTNPSSIADHISLNGQEAYSPQVAMDNNGNAIIVWDQYNGNGDWRIFKSEYREGVWHNPTNLADNISPNGSDADNPQVAMDNNGNAIIVWSSNDGTNYQIFKSECNSGIWKNPANITDKINPDGLYAWYPQVAMDNNGNAVIVWRQYDGIAPQIFKSEYRGGAWTNPVDITDHINPNGSSAGSPQVAMDNNGSAIIVWQQSDGANDQVFKSEYR